MLTLLIAWERQYFFYTYLGDIFSTWIHLSENWRLPLRLFFSFYLKVYSVPLPKLKIPNFYHTWRTGLTLETQVIESSLVVQEMRWMSRYLKKIKFRTGSVRPHRRSVCMHTKRLLEIIQIDTDFTCGNYCTEVRCASKNPWTCTRHPFFNRKALVSTSCHSFCLCKGCGEYFSEIALCSAR